ncbi:interleukin 15, like isoform X2 [Megalobrama amblycephala]|uniref:interleukin 15, like isoform X2 n=1 Tax=Megalobrama amblycephala TaxID=75352 RepID=UPI0020141181|nr:interleukin 15, like isoform X2 [Megalobrama amblycephala]
MTNLVLRWSWIFDMRTDLLHYSMCLTSLFLYVLIMLTRQIKCQSICSRESVDMVKRITVELSKVVWFLSLQENDCMLYTPTIADYENCSRSVLTCFALELNVLFVEIQSVARLSQQLLRILKKLKYKDTMKSCPDCELYQEKKAKTFLETLQNILQRINAEKTCPPRNVKRHLENLTQKPLRT